jgi:ATPase family associated with various cellular activities (AAA)
MTRDPSTEPTDAAVRHSLRRVRAKVDRRSSGDADAPRSREDLTQVRYTLAERKLRAQLRKDLDSRERLGEAHLRVEWQGIGVSQERLTDPHAKPVLRVIGRQLAEHPDVEFAGGDPKAPPRWDLFDLGGEVEMVPGWATIFWDPGTVANVPLILETWSDRGSQVIQVLSRAADRDVAKDYLDHLLQEAKGPSSPYRGRLLLGAWGNNGPTFNILPAPEERREDLILPTEIWQALDLNVHRMFERMPAFRSAGLGSNRGVLLAGSPGTGKTAACKVLAGEVLGDVTVVFVESRVAMGLLPRLYEEIAGMAPAMILLEDLDLIVGDREDGSARAPLFDFLSVLDGLMTQHRDVITLATTNDPTAVDEGVRRAARFDRIITFPLPDLDARERILEVYLRSVDHRVDLGRIARATSGATGADLREFVRSALLGVVLDESETLGTDHLLRVVAEERGLPADEAAALEHRYL